MKLKIALPVAIALLRLAFPFAASAANDALGVAQVYPTVASGKEWLSKWNNGVARTLTWGQDPKDPWLVAKGNASYAIDGNGLLKISGTTPRLYVHDPLKTASWRNVEMTVYAMRVADDSTAYAGIVGIARTNHGTTGSETSNLCDTRGYGSRMRNDGKIDFDKETSHPSATAGASKSLYSGGLPKNVWIGYKFVVYDQPDGTVKLETWRDTTDGLNGGTWTKVNELTDNGANFGVGAPACKSGINPALRLTNSDSRLGTESGKPNISVYWRSTNVGTNGLIYKKMSVREISPSAVAPSDTIAPVISAVSASGIGQMGATIGWTTNENADTLVEYGPTTAYGASTVLNTTLLTSHSAALSGLTAGTLYHYRVKSKDQAGNLAASGDNTFMTAAPTTPPTSAISFTDDFSSYVKNTCFADGASFGPWLVAFTGYGCVKTATDAEGSYVEEIPIASVMPAETHASMILGPQFSGPIIFALTMKTVAHTRTGSNPNPWEVAWVAWNYTDNTHFYYLALKPNGWELGKEDPAYPGAQRFLATGSSPIYPIGSWYNVRILQDSSNVISVYVDNKLITIFTDTERPYTSGRIAFYNEDAQVRLRNVAVNVTAPAPVAAIGAAAYNGSLSKAPQKLLSPARADGINDAAVFGTAASSVSIYDIKGKSVFHSSQPPIVWNGRDGAGRVVESGVYIAKIRENGAGVVFQSFVVSK